MHTTRTSSRMQCLALCALFERCVFSARDLIAVCMNCMQITIERLFANYFKLSQDFHSKSGSKTIIISMNMTKRIELDDEIAIVCTLREHFDTFRV